MSILDRKNAHKITIVLSPEEGQAGHGEMWVRDTWNRINCCKKQALRRRKKAIGGDGFQNSQCFLRKRKGGKACTARNVDPMGKRTFVSH